MTSASKLHIILKEVIPVVGTDQQKRYGKELENLRLIDDNFFFMVFDDNIEATQLVLRIILGKNDIKVTQVTAQREFKNITGHSVILDVLAVDEMGVQYDIEIQRSDKGAVPQRARYNSAMIDVNSLESGKPYTVLKENYVIFITENDIFKDDEPIHFIERVDRTTGKCFGDGSCIVYVNGAYHNNSSDIGKLMHDFRCIKATDMNFSELAKKVCYFKETKEGEIKMCKTFEEIEERGRMQGLKEVAVNMLKEGLALDLIIRSTGLTADELYELKKTI